MSREKQIGEMAKVLCDNCAGNESPCRVAKSGKMCGVVQREAEALYNEGYRKQSEVIHCRDCGVSHNKWTGCPKLNGLVTHPDFYCAYAEPKMKGGAE